MSHCSHLLSDSQLIYIVHSLNGVGAGPAETIAPTVIADIHFLHDRGKYNTTYFASYFAAYMVLIPSYFKKAYH